MSLLEKMLEIELGGAVDCVERDVEAGLELLMDEEIGRTDVELVEEVVDRETVEAIIGEELPPDEILDCMDDGPEEK